MNQTVTVICGNVADPPERRRAGEGQVTKFRMAATERRLDGATGQWADGRTFWVDVDCWNELGANVATSVVKGDPVIVKGHLWTSEWEGESGKRSRTVCTALAIGHDLSRGVSVFKRTVRATASATGVTGDAAGSDEPMPDEERYTLTEDGQTVDRETGALVETTG